MMSRVENQQITMHLLTIEDLVPQGHLLRKIDAAVDFSFIYDKAAHCYCGNNGRPSIDPVVLVKYLLVGFLYGLNSERRIEQEIQVNMAYRWFLGLDITGKVPDHSTISQNRRRRFNGTEVFRDIFEGVVFQCIEQGLVDGKLLFTDSTHVKANASRASEYVNQVSVITNEYLEELDQYEEAVRRKLESEGKIKPPTCSKWEPKEELVSRRESRTDPEAGFYKRKGKPEGMHYLSHQTVDSKHGIVVDVVATPGNVNDAQPYIGRIDYVMKTFGLNIEKACADSGYDTNLVNQQMWERGIEFYTPERTKQKRGRAEFTRDDFIYRAGRDIYECPCGKELRVHRLNRTTNGVTVEYRSCKNDCACCPSREKCLTAKSSAKRIQRNIFEDVVNHTHGKDGTRLHTWILNLRQIWSEGSFAAQKTMHNLKCLYRRGLEAAETHCLLSATALNLKRMAKMMA